MKSFYVSLVLSLVFTTALHAQLSVIDFENNDQYSVQHLDKPARCNVSGEFSTSGKQSFELGFPRWEDGMPEEYLIELCPAIKDWSEYGYIILDITNPTEMDWEFDCYITDDRESIKDGCHLKIEVPMFSTRTVSTHLKFKKDLKVNKEHISRIIFCSKKSEVPIHAVIDTIRLVKEKPQKGVFDDEIASQLRSLRIKQIRTNLMETRKSFSRKEILPQFADVIEKEAEQIFNKSQDMNISDDDLLLLVRDSQNLENSINRYIQFNKLYRDYKGLHEPQTNYIVGFGSSMRKVMPKHLPVDITISKDYKLSLAANEKESFQLVVYPYLIDLKDVKIYSSDLKSEDGQVIPASAIASDLVAFTRTRQRPSYGWDYPYVGWWPDPIIQDPKPVDVKLGDVQPWWIRIHAPKGQKAGTYHGKVTVAPTNDTPVDFDLEVEVYGFSMPDHQPFPVMLNTYPDMKTDKKDGPITPEEWSKLKYAFTDFLTEYYVIPDNIYRSTSHENNNSLDFELLADLKKKGKLAPFNLGYFYSGSDKHIDTFKYNYEKVKEMGLLEYAYMYGFDEQPSWAFPEINKAARKFQERYPETFNLTTTNDGESGNNPAMPYLKGYCPIIAGYDMAASQRARESLGKYVWWYTCVWPPHPYPNIFLEYQPIDTRTLLGFNAASHNVDGFLYYATMIFGKDNYDGISEYPYTNWNPISFMNTHGDGRMMYINDKKQLVPSMVLENFRDGLEDMAYYMILKHQVRELHKKHSGWVRLIRKGDTFIAFRSGDGKTWQKLGEKTVKMGKDVYIGLAATSHESRYAGRSVFRNIELKFGNFSKDWENVDIGAPAIDGWNKVDDGTITFSASSTDIGGQKDQFHFMYRSLSGNGQITAQITNMDATNEWAKAGVMIRETLESDAKNAFTFNKPGFSMGLGSISPSRGASFQGRSNQGGNSSQWGQNNLEPEWYFEAIKALSSTDSVISGLSDYTKDPKVLYRYRDKLAKLIESSPIKNTNPWGDRDGMPVRGLWRTWQDDLDGYKSPFREHPDDKE